MSKADVVRRIAPLLLDLCESERERQARVAVEPSADTPPAVVVAAGDFAGEAA